MRRIGKKNGGDRALASALGGIDALFQRRRARASRSTAFLQVDTPSRSSPEPRPQILNLIWMMSPSRIT